MFKTKIRILLIIVLLPGMFGVVIPQKADQKSSDPFAKVPQGQRERLKYRLSEFIEHQRKKEWDKAFDFLADNFKKNTKPGLTKEDFLKKRLYHRVSKFTADQVMTLPDGSDGFVIWGCGRFRFENNYLATVEAYYENGDWFFSTIAAAFSGTDVPPIGCRHK